MANISNERIQVRLFGVLSGKRSVDNRGLGGFSTNRRRKTIMAKDAGQFWTRYKRLAKKDLPVLARTGIRQPTLSSWRTKKLFPRADEAAAIAAALNTTVEFLVSGRDSRDIAVSPAALNISLTADTLDDEGLRLLAAVAESLALKYPSNQ